MWDVVIVGAGPAGTSAGFSLASEGFRVLLLDKKAFPRDKACAGGVTPKAMAAFPFDISPVVRRNVNRVRVVRPLGMPVYIRADRPLCHMTRRRELDRFCLDQALAKAVQFRIVKKIEAIQETPTHVEVVTDDGVILAACLIGADGANSRVRRLMGAGPAVMRYPALEADVRVSGAYKWEMTFDFSMGIRGYYWIFPRDDHVNIGVYSTVGGMGLKRRLLADYSEKLFGTREIKAVRGYPLGVGGFSYRPGPGRVLLAGDAAGFVETLLGEGIYFAVKSGQLAARAVLDAGEGGKPAGIIYRKHLVRLQTDLALHHAAATCLYTFPKPCLRLLSLPFLHKWFARGYAAGKPLSRILFS